MEKFGSEMEKIRILDPEWEKFGFGMEKIRIRDPGLTHPGSATLVNCKRRERTADHVLRAVVSFGKWAEGD
jgi:hypothetical protein